MANRTRYRDHVDPEYRRWGQTYPRFPGVAECVRLIEANRATGAWADIVVDELAAHATDHLADIIDAYRATSSHRTRMLLLMAIELAQPEAAVPFLAEVFRTNDVQLANWAKKGLGAIDSRASRTVLWTHENGPGNVDPADDALPR